MSDTHEQLREAYQLAQQDRIEEAQRILRPILDAEPNNVQAWWILAHAVETPTEARAALQKVLELDPNFSQAEKARQMLRQIDEQFPEVSAAENTSPSVFTEEDMSFFAEMEEGPATDAFTDDALDQYGVIDESFFSEEEDLAEFENVLDTADAFELDEELDTGTNFLAELSDFEEEEPPHADDEQALRDLFATPPETVPELGDDALAMQEERAARQRGGTLRTLLGVVLLAAVIAGAAVWAWLNFFSGEEAKEPGALTALEASSLQEATAITAAQQALDRAGLGQTRRALIAETPLGRTFMVEFCTEPSPTLADDVNNAMRIVLEQVSTVEGVVDAVGISVNRCQAPQYDTLYRALVAYQDADNYRDQAFIPDEARWAEFQQYWHTS